MHIAQHSSAIISLNPTDKLLEPARWSYAFPLGSEQYAVSMNQLQRPYRVSGSKGSIKVV